MRERRRTLIAGALLVVAMLWLDRPTPRVSLGPDMTGPVPRTAQAAIDLGILGTIALSWTIDRLK